MQRLGRAAQRRTLTPSWREHSAAGTQPVRPSPKHTTAQSPSTDETSPRTRTCTSLTSSMVPALRTKAVSAPGRVGSGNKHADVADHLGPMGDQLLTARVREVQNLRMQVSPMRSTAVGQGGALFDVHAMHIRRDCGVEAERPSAQSKAAWVKLSCPRRWHSG